jgi:hypothetical protein
MLSFYEVSLFLSSKIGFDYFLTDPPLYADTISPAENTAAKDSFHSLGLKLIAWE